jgi:hypothetical protein
MADKYIRGSYFNHADEYAKPQEPRLQVRCCCTPTKVLGSLPAPEGQDKYRTFQLRGGGELLLMLRNYCQRTQVTDELLARAADPVVAAYLQQVNVSEPAYYSEDTPLEVLRRIPEFLEAAP